MDSPRGSLGIEVHVDAARQADVNAIQKEDSADSKVWRMASKTSVRPLLEITRRSADIS